MNLPRTRRPWKDVIALRQASTKATVVMTVVAALAGWVWLDLAYAGLWFVSVMAGLAVNRAVCAWMLRRPEAGPRMEWTLAAVTFVYTCIYCVLPYGLVVVAPAESATLAGIAMIGAIALPCTSELVISRRVGSGPLSALLVMSLLIIWQMTTGEPLLNQLFALLGIAGFFACIVQFAMHRMHDDARYLDAVVEAQAANAAKSLFLATMSHEIRTPLNGVLGMAQAMAADELSGPQRERLSILRDAGGALTEILNDVLDLSKIEAGKMELESLDFDLVSIVRSTTASFGALAGDKGLTLAEDIGDGALGLYRGDPARVRQVVANLISNAVKFTASGGITVTVRREGGELAIAVTDTGPGVPADQIESLFRKFAQLDSSTTRRHGGTGLGLAICRELCALMGGDISLASVPGEGSTFTVRLPLEWVGDAPAVSAIDAPSEPAAMPALRVLAAEDNRINQIVLQTLLAQVGVSPVMVGDGAQAVEAFAQQSWDLILMDVHMPVLDGIGAVRAIREHEAAQGRPRTPVIALTANAMAHQVADLLAAGMDHHVAKPIDAGVLFAIMERALGEAEQRAAAAA
ncbi:MAG: ATP-binding protein [Caulobacter sp.]|nr:ATP-binding protein [Caulobacter sp.]